MSCEVVYLFVLLVYRGGGWSRLELLTMVCILVLFDIDMHTFLQYVCHIAAQHSMYITPFKKRRKKKE